MVDDGAAHVLAVEHGLILTTFQELAHNGKWISRRHTRGTRLQMLDLKPVDFAIA